MRKLLTASIASAVLVLAGAAPALAHQAGPCNDSDGDGSFSGQEYAAHHIVAAAHVGGLGSDNLPVGHPGNGHSPGSHQGFSACL
ncbi:MAG: hypothetical protein KY469_10205 [Actinobacteria bacterium]|nr:hypothetical protein [Actinomycetota bacterium]